MVTFVRMDGDEGHVYNVLTVASGLPLFSTKSICSLVLIVELEKRGAKPARGFEITHNNSFKNSRGTV